MIRFSESHEWVKLEGESVTIGITDYAQSQLGDIVFVELPKVGDRVKSKEQFGTIESTKAASELYSPIDGLVSEVNNKVIANPQLINESALDFGWLLKLKSVDSSQTEHLMDEANYREFVEKETK